MKDKIAVDFDQTLTRDMGYNPYPDLGEEVPDHSMIEWVNRQSKEHYIIIHTARDEELREETKKWLDNYDVQYDRIEMGKLEADIYVDDKAVRPDEAKHTQSTRQIKHLMKPMN